ncbi:MAG: PEP-CTERM sorting domain-containing protein [Akkermansiaceae bacterium]
MKKIFILFYIGAINIGSSSMTLSWVYDESTMSTTVIYSGSWDIFSEDILTGTPTSHVVDSDFFFIGQANYEFTLDDKFSDTFSWVTASVTSTTGDAFGFDNQFALYSPENYNAGENISGSATFAGTDLTALSLNDGETGSYTSDLGNIVNYSVTSIPEPSSAMLLVLGSVGFMMRRRR